MAIPQSWVAFRLGPQEPMVQMAVCGWCGQRMVDSIATVTCPSQEIFTRRAFLWPNRQHGSSKGMGGAPRNTGEAGSPKRGPGSKGDPPPTEPSVRGVEKRIVRGDFHRHTELSWDLGGRIDGSLFDFYRYMIDAAAMDFGAVTDHISGADYEYWWWLTEKSCDMYHVPGTFTTFYAYERSAWFPNGHRNIFHTRRGVPVVQFFTEGDFGEAPPEGVGGALVENDTKLLYESLHQTGGIAISHSSASDEMGTDWRDNDPKVEPVVEIFQGLRTSNEYQGAPRAARSAEDNPSGGGFQEAGFVWNAYSKGYRLGTIASSDHYSTHISYAMALYRAADPGGHLRSV